MKSKYLIFTTVFCLVFLQVHTLRAENSCRSVFEGTFAVSLQNFLSQLASDSDLVELDEKQSLDFVSPGEDPHHLERFSDLLREVGPYLTDEDLSLAKAQTSPQPLTLGGTRSNKRGGLAVWKNQLFPVDYFVRQFTAWKASGEPSEKLFQSLEKMPWIHYENGDFSVQRTQGSAVLLSFLQVRGQSSLRLYRGTTELEAQLMGIAQDLKNQRALDPTWTEKLTQATDQLMEAKKRNLNAAEDNLKQKFISPEDYKKIQNSYEKALSLTSEFKKDLRKSRTIPEVEVFTQKWLVQLLNQGEFLGVFTTPSPERAALFSKGAVVEFEIGFRELEELLRQKKIYVGIEKMTTASGEEAQVEIAFLANPSATSVDQLARLIVSIFWKARPSSASTLFN